MLKVRNLADLRSVVDQMDPMQVTGSVTRVVGTVIEGQMPDCAVGQMCEITAEGPGESVLAEIVGFNDHRVVLMPLGEMRGLHPGSEIRVVSSSPTAQVGEELLGRVINGMGEPIDGKGPIECQSEVPLYAAPGNPFQRRRITQPLDVGIRSINALLTTCVGQRMAIMAGSGVGKSVLLGMIARNTEADVNVISLVGERGRELKDFIERDLGEEGLRRSVVVAATSEVPALIRVRAAFLATAIAEYYRSAGKNVLLMMDSVTRFAMAQREVGLSAGEPPTSKGYTPSVFAMLPRLLERVGMGDEDCAGSITGLYAVLVEGDDFTEPISDAVRSILDGHIVLSRDLADKGHFPAVDLLGSVSRLMSDVVSPEQREWAMRISGHLAAYRRAETLINIGAYARGANPEIDAAIDVIGEIDAFLRQGMDEKADMASSLAALERLATKTPVPPPPTDLTRRNGAGQA
jgi:flagellum-specific ATP synthase